MCVSECVRVCVRACASLCDSTNSRLLANKTSFLLIVKYNSCNRQAAKVRNIPQYQVVLTTHQSKDRQTDGRTDICLVDHFYSTQIRITGHKSLLAGRGAWPTGGTEGCTDRRTDGQALFLSHFIATKQENATEYSTVPRRNKKNRLMETLLLFDATYFSS